ncbi:MULTISPECIES: hypothetical protein [unclassified Rhizobium]|uniref:hypothetical protein n=1 Tax=unclassified Rhizobium TaxID=2613769 RepID=UPI000BE9A007|nr:MULTISPECIES: hypothetical protein [unclassified Rhizobium]MDF0664188.1 hypothetical protein [Rhizobium sp. BC49]PDS77840.1 hypothetical protein CO654_33675 [Rhizobium sp. L18]
MTTNWRDDLRLKLEDFVDTFVVNGAKQVDVYNAIQKELDFLRAAHDRDPDPTDDPGDVVEEPSNDWPASQGLVMRLVPCSGSSGIDL